MCQEENNRDSDMEDSFNNNTNKLNIGELVEALHNQEIEIKQKERQLEGTRSTNAMIKQRLNAFKMKYTRRKKDA